MKNLHYRLTLTLNMENKCFGPGPMMLLQGIEKTGSLKQSASSMCMAYSKAWKLIKELEEIWEFPILLRKSGGVNGGGSVLTPEGKKLLENYQNMFKDVDEYTKKSFKKYFGDNF